MRRGTVSIYDAVIHTMHECLDCLGPQQRHHVENCVLLSIVREDGPDSHSLRCDGALCGAEAGGLELCRVVAGHASLEVWTQAAADNGHCLRVGRDGDLIEEAHHLSANDHVLLKKGKHWGGNELATAAGLRVEGTTDSAGRLSHDVVHVRESLLVRATQCSGCEGVGLTGLLELFLPIIPRGVIEETRQVYAVLVLLTDCANALGGDVAAKLAITLGRCGKGSAGLLQALLCGLEVGRHRVHIGAQLAVLIAKFFRRLVYVVDCFPCPVGGGQIRFIV